MNKKVNDIPETTKAEFFKVLKKVSRKINPSQHDTSKPKT